MSFDSQSCGFVSQPLVELPTKSSVKSAITGPILAACPDLGVCSRRGSLAVEDGG